MSYSDRLKLYQEIEKDRDTAVLTYVTSDRLGMQTAINADVIDPFVDLLDKIGPVERGLIEGSSGRAYAHISEGLAARIEVESDLSLVPQTLVHDDRRFDGWKRIG